MKFKEPLRTPGFVSFASAESRQFSQVKWNKIEVLVLICGPFMLYTFLKIYFTVNKSSR